MGLFDRFRPEPETRPTGETIATVSQHQLVELFNADGLPTYVAASDVESWLRHGLTRTRYDADVEADAIAILFDSAKHAVLEHVEASRANGAVQREAEAAVAQAGFSELTAGFGRLMYALEHRYPHVEPEAVEVLVDGKTVRIDPSQVDHYRSLGATE